MRAGTQNSIDGLQDKELFPENNRGKADVGNTRKGKES